MAFWLLKTEPSVYSFERLVQEKTARWDGVTNPVALKNLRAMQSGDELAIYHTGDVKAVVGLARVIKTAYPDPNADEPKLVVVDIAAGRALKTPVPLATFKSDAVLKTNDVARLPRLSVIPMTDEHWKRMLELAV